MKKLGLPVSMFLFSSMLLWSVTPAMADAPIVKETASLSAYCHMKFPPLLETNLSREHPVLDESAGNVIDFYGPCDYDPTGVEEIGIQRRLSHESDGE